MDRQQTKRPMKKLHALVGLTICGCLIGCAHDQPAGDGATKPAKVAVVSQPAAFSVMASTNGSLFYQWQFNGTNVGGVTNR
jgi:hypothetical protein